VSQNNIFKTTFKDDAITNVGWNLSSEITLDDWKGKGLMFADFTFNTTNWMWGDWWNAGHKYGTRGDLVNSPSWKGPVYQVLINYGTTCKKFEITLRSVNLSFAHYRIVTSLDLPIALDWLKQAETNSWSISVLKQKMYEEFMRKNSKKEDKEPEKDKKKEKEKKQKEDFNRQYKDQQETENEEYDSFKATYGETEEEFRTRWKKEHAGEFDEILRKIKGNPDPIIYILNEVPELRKKVLQLMKQYLHPDRDTGNEELFKLIGNLE
jgi:hypothetical protein